MTRICIGKLTTIVSERRQAIIWTNAGILLIGPLGTNFSEILFEIQSFSLKKIRLKMSSAKCCSFPLGLNVLTHHSCKFQPISTRHGSGNPLHTWVAMVNPGFMLFTHPANERRCCIVTSSLIGWMHTQDDPCESHYLGSLPKYTPFLWGTRYASPFHCFNTAQTIMLSTMWFEILIVDII